MKNPGISYSNPLVAKAVEKGLPVYTEIEIAQRVMEGTVLGITGSNGKTTTTTLTNLMLKESFPERRTLHVEILVFLYPYLQVIQRIRISMSLNYQVSN